MFCVVPNDSDSSDPVGTAHSAAVHPHFHYAAAVAADTVVGHTHRTAAAVVADEVSIVDTAAGAEADRTVCVVDRLNAQIEVSVVHERPL